MNVMMPASVGPKVGRFTGVGIRSDRVAWACPAGRTLRLFDWLRLAPALLTVLFSSDVPSLSRQVGQEGPDCVKASLREEDAENAVLRQISPSCNRVGGHFDYCEMGKICFPCNFLCNPESAVVIQTTSHEQNRTVLKDASKGIWQRALPID